MAFADVASGTSDTASDTTSDAMSDTRDGGSR